MKYTTIQFQSMQQLWEFVKFANIKNYHFDKRNCTLWAEVSVHELWIAKTHFGAMLQEPEKKGIIQLVLFFPSILLTYGRAMVLFGWRKSLKSLF
jgi:hypothetical protein